jgi:ubiquitin-conjugating enzyme E2 G1
METENQGVTRIRQLPPHTLPSAHSYSLARMSKPGTPANSYSSQSNLILKRQLLELQKRPVEGFSAGTSRRAPKGAVSVS